MATHLTTDEVRQGSAGFLLRLDFELKGFTDSYLGQTWRVKIVCPDGRVLSKTSGIEFLTDSPKISVPIVDFDLIQAGTYYYQVTLLTGGANINSSVHSFRIEGSLPDGIEYSVISSSFNYFPIFTSGGGLAQSTLRVDEDTDLNYSGGGAKFAGDVLIPDEIYGASWDGKLEAATKNSIYDKIQSLSKADIGLGNVDNTSDAQKPISTAQQTALDLKANLSGATFTGIVSVPTEAYSGAWAGNTSVPTKASLYSHLESGTLLAGNLYPYDWRLGIVPTDYLGRVTTAFATYSNDGTGAYADALVLSTWINTSGGNQNQVLFNKTDFGIRLFQSGAEDTVVPTSYRDVVLTENSPTIGYIPKYNRVTDGVTVSNSSLSSPTSTLRVHNTDAIYYNVSVDGQGVATVSSVGATPRISFSSPTWFNNLLFIQSGQRIQSGLAPADSGAFSLTNWGGTGVGIPLAVKTQTTNGGDTPSSPEPALVLMREGVNAEAYANFVEFNLARWEDAGVSARTRLDIALTHGNGDAIGTSVLSVRSDGRVGIGTTSPSAALHVAGRIITTDEAYGVGWDGSLEVPTKNALYDKVESVVSGIYSLPSLTSGSILFSDGSDIAQDNAQLFWNNSTKRLGIGTNLPQYKLHVQGTDAGINLVRSGNDPFIRLGQGAEAGQVRLNGAGDLYFTVNDNGVIALTAKKDGTLTTGLSVTSAAKVVVQSYTQQLGLYYNNTNNLGVTIGSTGIVSLIATGTGAKFSFNSDVEVPDEAYGAGWDGSLEVPTKNALYDKIETLGVSASWGSITGTLSDQTDLNSALNSKEPTIAAGTTSQYWRGDKSWQTLDKAAVGLSNVVNSLQLVASNNLSDITNQSTARTNLGLGTLATQNGTFSGTSSGTNTGDQTIALTGDVTGSGTGTFPATIANGAVTLAKMANVNSGTVFYRKTASAGVPEVQTLATLKADLGLTGTNTGDQDLSGLLVKANNLSDLTNTTTARSNLGLGTVATLNTGTSSGNIPVLGAGGLLATSVIPAVAIVDVNVVASQAAQLALTAQEGDVAIRTDLNKSYIHNGGTAGTMADWQELLTPTDSVTSVNGQTGVVVLTKSDVGLANVTNDAQLKISSNLSDLNNVVTARTNLGLGTLATQNGTFSGTSSGTNTGDVSLSGQNYLSITNQTITANKISLSNMADVATGTVFYRKTAGSGSPEVQTLATLKTDLGLSGTNTGDQTITLTGDVTGSGTGSFATTIANSAVTYAKIQNMTTNNLILGRITVGAGAVQELTAANVKTILALTKTDVGLGNVQNVDQTNASNLSSGTVNTARLGSGTADSTTFLRGDNTWQTVDTLLSIGDPITGGGANQVLFQDGSQNLNSIAGFTATDSQLKFATTSESGATGALRIEFAGLIGSYTSGLTIRSTAGNSYYANHIRLEGAAYNKYGGISVANHDGLVFAAGTVGRFSFSGPLVITPHQNNTYPVLIQGTVAKSTQVGMEMNLKLDQTADAYQLKDSGGNILTRVDAVGTIYTSKLQVEYDASNYFSTTVGATGAVTFNAVGSGSKFIFSDDVEVPDEAYGAGWNGSLEVPTKNAVYDQIQAIVAGGGAAWGSITGTLSAQTDLQNALNAKEGTITAGTTAQYWRGDKSWQTLDKAAVGLANVANVDTTNAANISSGTLPAGRMPALTGDVTTTVGTVATTIANGAVTLAKMANVNSGTVFYRKTASAGAPEVQTLATLKTDLGLTGTNTGDQTITLTGNVTGSGTGSFATTIANGAVTLAKMANVATGTVFYRKTAGAGAPEVQTLATLKTDLAITKSDVGLANVTNDAQLKIASNLSDLANVTTARSNLGLGTVATLNTGTSSGNVPVLGAGGFLPTSVIPAVAIVDVNVVASEVAQLALTAQEGDVAVRTDLNKSYIHNGGTAGTMADWQELLTPTDTVTSVNGQTGVVVLTKSDVGLGNVTNDAQLKIASNLSDLANVVTARSNLGLGTLATQNGTFSGTSSGTNTGDVSLSGQNYLSIAGQVITANKIALANMADVATGTVFYRKTAGSGSPEVQTLATLKTDLGLTGTNSGDQTITLTGHVTGSGTGSFATTIANNVVTLGKLQTIQEAVILGRITSGVGNVEELTPAEVKSILTLVPADVGLGSVQNVDQTNASNLSSGTVPAGRMPALTGDITTTAGTVATTIANNAVTTGKIQNNAVSFAKMQTIATTQFLGRATAGIGSIESFGASTAKILLGLNNVQNVDQTNASNLTSGTVNTARLGSGTANTTTFLRGDNTWQTVSASAAWGSITGTLSSQTDLQNALNAKASLSGATFSGSIVADGGLQLGANDNLTSAYQTGSISFHSAGSQNAISFTPQGNGGYWKTFVNVNDLYFQFVPVTGITRFDVWASSLALGSSGGNALYINSSNNVAVGHGAPSVKLHVINTAEQLRVGYSTSQYLSMTVGSNSATTLNITGTSPSLTLSNGIGLYARIIPRGTSTTSASSLTPSATGDDLNRFTALATNLTINAPTGTAIDGQKLMMRFKDNGTSRTLTWNAIYRGVGVTLPTTTVASKTMYIGFVYNSTDTKWDCVSVAQEA